MQGKRGQETHEASAGRSSSDLPNRQIFKAMPSGCGNISKNGRSSHTARHQSMMGGDRRSAGHNKETPEDPQ